MTLSAMQEGSMFTSQRELAQAYLYYPMSVLREFELKVVESDHDSTDRWIRRSVDLSNVMH